MIWAGSDLTQMLDGQSEVQPLKVPEKIDLTLFIIDTIILVSLGLRWVNNPAFYHGI